MNRLIIAAVAVAAVGGGAAWYFLHRTAPVQFRTVPASRGDLKVVATATGQIFPFVQVQVGTQVTGVIQRLYVDFNCIVKAGQQVAQIDQAPFQSIVDQNRANLLAAKAQVGNVKANLIQAEKDLGRDRELAKKDLIAPTDLDAAVAKYDSLVAQVAAAEASVEQAKATLQSSEVNLAYTKIISPIDGVVIQRSVDVGQTLAASLSAPTIYVIADEMKKIQIQASVAEADIGRISEGQDVTFTVDAYRETQFKGKVSQIRLFPTTVQNVVTYTVMIDADNPGGKLLPGMTANATFEIREHKNVLKIPNAALRFTPPWEAAEAGHKPPSDDKDKEKDKEKEPSLASDSHDAPRGGDAKAASLPADAPVSAPIPPAPGPAQTPTSPYVYKSPDAPQYRFGGARPLPGAPRGRKARVRIWVRGAAGAEPVFVVPGATDGSFTEVISGDLAEGQEVITGIIQEGAEAAMSNPFTPQYGRPPAGGNRR
jgi:HlyD family secretion protein